MNQRKLHVNKMTSDYRMDREQIPRRPGVIQKLILRQCEWQVCCLGHWVPINIRAREAGVGQDGTRFLMGLEQKQGRKHLPLPSSLLHPPANWQTLEVQQDSCSPFAFPEPSPWSLVCLSPEANVVTLLNQHQRRTRLQG